MNDERLNADSAALKREIKQYLWEHIHIATPELCEAWAEAIFWIVKRHNDGFGSPK